MKISGKTVTTTKLKYLISGSSEELNKYKTEAASKMSTSVKIPGFRPGKAPPEVIAKFADQAALQNDFLNLAINDLYIKSTEEVNLRIIGEPVINITKFVPFTTLEVSVEVPILKDIKLPEYRKFKTNIKKPTVSKDLIDGNIKELQKRSSEPKPVKRPAKMGDQVVIDFDGSDFKTKEHLDPASSKDFKLVLGENSLIPGFEQEVVGLSQNKSKTFNLVFPKDYQDKSYASRKITFKVTLKEVNEMNLPKLDDDFAKTVGPFKSIKELEAELKKQIQADLDRQSKLDLDNEILSEIAEKTEVKLDDSLVESELKMLLEDAKKSALNRGQTWQEFLSSRGETDEQYEKQLKTAAITRIKGGIAIGEIASNEGLRVSNQEIESQIQLLKAQYSEPQMQKELDLPENKREIGMRILTEKVLDFIKKSSNLSVS